MRVECSVLLVVACGLLALSMMPGAAHAMACNYTSSSGAIFNLAPLTINNAASKADYYMGTHTEGSDTFDMYTNVCAGVPKANCAEAGTAACQNNRGGTLTSCGVDTQATFSDYIDPSTGKPDPNGGVILTYGGGLGCGQFGPRQTALYLSCDPSATTPKVLGLDEPSSCKYRMEIATMHACPVNPPVDYGTVSVFTSNFCPGSATAEWPLNKQGAGFNCVTPGAGLKIGIMETESQFNQTIAGASMAFVMNEDDSVLHLKLYSSAGGCATDDAGAQVLDLELSSPSQQACYTNTNQGWTIFVEQSVAKLFLHAFKWKLKSL